MFVSVLSTRCALTTALDMARKRYRNTIVWLILYCLHTPFSMLQLLLLLAHTCVQYFKCTAGHGIFVRQNAVALLPAVKRSASANTGLTAQQPTASASTAATDKSEKGHESHTSAVIDARAAALGAENVPS
jgi:hypothetical protein